MGFFYVMSSTIGLFFSFGFGFVYMDGQLSKYVLFMLCVSRVAVCTLFLRHTCNIFEPTVALQ
jgi:hypothetical protein